MKTKAQNKKTQLPKHYTSIDELPIANWWSIEEKNDLGFMLRFPRKLKANEKLMLLPKWNQIVDEFIDHFGINKEYKQILNIRRNIELCAIDYALTKEKILLTEKKIYERQLESIVGKKVKSENEKALIYASKFMQYRIDKKQTTVKEFYTIISAMKESQKKEQPAEA